MKGFRMFKFFCGVFVGGFALLYFEALAGPKFMEGVAKGWRESTEYYPTLAKDKWHIDPETGEDLPEE